MSVEESPGFSRGRGFKKDRKRKNMVKEILLLLTGDAKLENKEIKTILKKEQAVYMSPDEAFTFIAMSDCKYIVAGTHTTPHDH